MSIYVTKVKTNVKKVQEVQLGRKTLIVGSNGAGKSSILNSIELCFGGYVSDYRGKVVKLPRDIHSLSAQDDLSVQCTLSDNTKKSFSIKQKKDKTLSRPKVYGKSELALPIKEITDILEGSTKAFKTWLLRHVTPSIDKDDFEAFCNASGIDSNLLDFDNLIESIETQIEVHKDQINKFAGLIRSRKKTIKDFAQTIDSNVDLNAPEEYRKAKNQLEDFERKDAMMNHYMKQIQAFMKKGQELTDRRTLIKGKLDTINMHPNLLPTKEEIIAYNIRKDVVDMLGLHQSLDHTSQCLVCGGALELVDEKIEALDKSAIDIQNKLDLLKIKVELEQEYTEVQDAITDLVNQLNKIKYDQDQLAQRMVTIEKDECDFLKNKIERLKAKKDAVQTYTLRRKELERVKEELIIMEQEQLAYKQRLTGLQKIQTEVVWEAKDKFTDRLNEHLSFKIDLEISDKNINIGKMIGEKICFGLSGAEYLELKIGLARALYPENSIILMEDKAVDDVTLVKIMDKVSTLSNQVVLTSVFMPSTIPEDWIVVEL